MRTLSRSLLSRLQLSPSLRCPSSAPLLVAKSSPLRRLYTRGGFSPVDTACSVLAGGPARLLQTRARRGGQVKPFVLADIGEGITECEIVKWLVKPGDTIEEFDPLVEVMSDKASVEITSPFSGTIQSLAGNAGDMLKVGSTLCDIDVVGEAAEESVEPATASTAVEFDESPAPPAPSPLSPTPDPPSSAPIASPSPADGREILVTPATRRIARENGVDLAMVKGTGKNGRIMNEDVLAAAKTTSSPPPPATPASSTAVTSGISPSPPLADAATIPLSSTRRAMFRAMTSSLAIPHFAYSDTLDVTELECLRLKLSSEIPLHLRKTLSLTEETQLSRRAQWGVSKDGERVEEARRIDRVTLLPLLLKALSLAMSEHPLFLCTLSPSSSSSSVSGEPTLLRRPSHDISIALSSPSPSGGLFTPVLRSVHSSSVFTLASQLAFLQSHLSPTATSPPRFPAEHQGVGTLTLSNVGVVGGRTTHPVIPPTGQLAIGAVGRVRVEPRFVDERMAREVALGRNDGTSGSELKVESRLVLDASFSADHRVVEGVELARLVETWKRIVESPSKLLGAQL